MHDITFEKVFISTLPGKSRDLFMKSPHQNGILPFLKLHFEALYTCFCLPWYTLLCQPKVGFASSDLWKSSSLCCYQLIWMENTKPFFRPLWRLSFHNIQYIPHIPRFSLVYILLCCGLLSANFTHILQGYITGSGTIIQSHWNKPPEH